VNVGGGVSYIVGPMGSGKTLRAVRGMISALCSQKYVVTNVRLIEGWEDRVAKHVARTSSKERKQQIARKLRGYYLFVEDLDHAFNLITGTEIPGHGEGRAHFYWDESQNDLNNRTWRGKSANDQKRREEAEKRVDILEVATQFRKLGIEGYILSQHTDNTDVAIRRACNWVIRMQNQREQTRMLGVRITPWPLFLGFWYPSNVVLGKANPVRTERYFLDWHRHLYDTMGLYHGVANRSAIGRVMLPSDGLTDEAKEALLKIVATGNPAATIGDPMSEEATSSGASELWTPGASAGAGRSRIPTLRVPSPTSVPDGSC
jgi:hypothetical protein